MSRLLAPTLATIIFLVDTFANMEIAIAVLYVLVMLLLADTVSRRGILVVVTVCIGLAITSHLISHGRGGDFSSLFQLCVSIAAILISGSLLLRDNASRACLIKTNDALTQSEWRFRSIFEQARFSLWEQDFTKVYELLETLKAQGVTNLVSHAERFPDLARDISDLIVTTNVNQATLELLGASSNLQVVGPLTPFVPPDSSGFLRVIQALFEGRDRFEGRASILGVDGKVRTILIGMTFPDKTKESRRVIANLVDITQREKTREALLVAQAELARMSRAATVGVFSASIAHELNQPLAALLMNAQTFLRWIRHTPPNINAASKAAERTVRDGERAIAIIAKTRNMLVKGAGHQEAIDLYQLSSEIADLMERELREYSVRLSIDGADGVAKVRANRVEMQQVLVNLIGNGIQAMADCSPSKRAIAITIAQSGTGDVRVSVRDHGTGVDPGEVTKLFDPFFTTKESGMGMGLAISRSVIEAVGGRLTARNHEEGGAVFEFVLPGIFEEGANYAKSV